MKQAIDLKPGLARGNRIGILAVLAFLAAGLYLRCSQYHLGSRICGAGSQSGCCSVVQFAHHLMHWIGA